LRLFKKDEDYAAFNRILVEAHQRLPIRILDWCLMPNHWHFVVYPRCDDEVTGFFRWLTHTHAMRAITHRRTLGMGPLYQGRFKSLPVQRDEHLETLLRYVQRNPLRAALVRQARRWKWGGHWARRNGDDALRGLLSPWPIAEPADWDAWVDAPQTPAEIAALREHIRRSRPYGSKQWTQATAQKLSLEWTLRPRGRPRSEQDVGKEIRPECHSDKHFTLIFRGLFAHFSVP
jgi:putative transposase